MSRKRVLSAVLTAAMALIAFMVIFSASCSDVFAIPAEEKPVKKASFTVNTALCGTEVKIEEDMSISDSPSTQSPEPEVTADEGSELIFPKDSHLPKLWLNTTDVLKPAEYYEPSDSWFSGVLTPETEVYVAIFAVPKDGYYIDWESDMDITVNGEKAKLYYLDSDGIANPVVAKVTVTHDYGEWEKLNDAQHQKVCKHDPSHVLKENHKWDKGKVTRKSTTTSKGSKTFTCTACKATKTEDIPKLKPSTPKVSGTATAKMTVNGKDGLTLSWKKIKGAAGYDIFFARCNHHGKKIVCTKVKNIKGNNKFKWTNSHLKEGTSYKAYVKAYIYKDGKKQYVRSTPMMHAYTGNGTKKRTNAKSVTIKNVKDGKLSLETGKTFKIKAKVNKLKKNKKLMPTRHVARLRYLSSDKKVATVSKKGTITAKGSGTCTITAFAHNGVSKTIKVTVP